eukprot:scaffold1146_cov399-Prasinococcus_capsulatus_cf.AAC.76
MVPNYPYFQGKARRDGVCRALQARTSWPSLSDTCSAVCSHRKHGEAPATVSPEQPLRKIGQPMTLWVSSAGRKAQDIVVGTARRAAVAAA